SREEGTRSHDLDEQVPEHVARERADVVTRAAEETMARRAESLVGTELEVLVEKLDIAQGIWTGRSHREAPEVDGEITFTAGRELRVGEFTRVAITGSDGADLHGAVV
ncbi:MAG: TRAM domain-containing protein, partial [Actinomycetota bacterium]